MRQKQFRCRDESERIPGHFAKSAAVADMAAALGAQEYLEQRAARASRATFEAALAQVPDVPADPSERIRAR